MIFENAVVFCEDGVFRQRTFFVKDGCFSHEQSGGTVDLKGKTVIPGLIDTHIHGAAGCDFTSGTSGGLKKTARFLAENGVTSFMPTSLTAPVEMLKSALKNAAEVKKSEYAGARVIGVHMEGPFFSKERRGAQSEKFIKLPDFKMFSDLNRLSGGIIKTICIAPELEGALNFISEASKICRVSAGHSACGFEEAKNAISAGVSVLTHLYNAMPPLLHREPGLIGAAADAGLFAELICDGIHVHESAVRAAFRLFGAERIILVSDSLSACGAAEGECFSGTERILLKDGAATLSDGKTLAGSVTTLYDCMRKAISFGIPSETAVAAATKNPAVSLGLYDQIGSITPGKRADFIVCGSDFIREAVYINGIELA